MEFVVDIQCFQSNSIYFIKELAILNLAEDDTVPKVFIFNPPYSWCQQSHQDKITNRWLELNHHGIPWSLPGQPQSEISHILFKYLHRADVVYVKGNNKADLLKKYLPHM